MKLLSLLIVLLSWSSLAYGQQNMTLFQLQNAGIGNELNPSKSPQTKWYFGLPGLSNAHVSYSHSGFNLNDAIKVVNDSMQLDFNGTLSAMSKHNYFQSNAQIGLLQFGIKLNKTDYFSFHANLRSSINVRYDREPIELLVVGNGPFINTNKKINFETNSSIYYEYALGFSRTYAHQKVGFGGKLKLLSGIANINFKKNDIHIRTNNENYGIEVTSDLDLKSSGTQGGNMSPWSSNLGAAIDFGFFYKWKNNIEFTGSLLDLGAIRWKDKVKNYRSNQPGSTVVFEGMTFSDYFDEETSYKEAGKELLDSLKSEFKLDENQKAYTSSIPTQLYLAVNYQFRKNTNVGLMGYSHFFKSRPIPGIGLSLNQKISKGIELTTTYSYFNKEAANIGFGFTVNLGCLQWVTSTDNVLSFMEYATANNANLRTSFSFHFGRENRLPKYIRKQNRFHRKHRGGHGNASF